MKKRLLSFLLAVLMVFGTVISTLPAIEVEAANIVIGNVDIGYSNNSFFTKNGQSCKDNNNVNINGVAKASCHNRTGYNCVNTTDPSCNCMRYWPTGVASTCQVDLLSSQCFGFVRYCQWKVYGTFDQISSSFVKNTVNSSCSAEKLKSMLLNCAPATHIRTLSSEKGYGHSICVVSTNNDGLTFADCNSDGGCKVRVATYSWAELANFLNGYGGVEYITSSSSVPVPPNPTPPVSNSTIIHMDSPSSGAYPNEHGNIEISGWIASDEAVTSVKMSIGGYGDIVLNGGAITHAADVKKAYPNHKYTVRFRGVIERSRLKSNTKYSYTITSNVSGSYTGEFTIGQVIGGESYTPDHIIHIDSPVGNYVGYNHIELKGWIACNTKPAYIMAEIPGKQYNMEFYDNNPTESYPGYKYFMRFYTVIDINLLASNQTYTLKVWSSLGGISITTFSTGNISPTKYGVNFNNNGGSGTIQGLTVISGEKATIPSTVPKREGYSFLGWSTSSTATTPTYKSGNSFTVKSNVTLYAVWKPNTYTVSYNLNGGTGAISNQTKTHDVSLILNKTLPEKSGYVFVGWDLSSSAEIPVFKPGDEFLINADTTLYAVWEKYYTVTFIATEGTAAFDPIITTGEIVLPEFSNRDGYKFVGWSKKESFGFGILIPAGSSVTVTEDTTYYAIWECIHQYSTVKTEATCTDEGYTTYTCKTCGRNYVSDEVDPLGHSYGDWSVTIAATCTAGGAERRDCIRCDHYETRDTDALGHMIVNHNAKAATCTEKGWNAYKTCSRCDYTTYTELPATGHNYGSWSKQDDTYHSHKCSNCGNTEKSEHSWNDGVITKEPTQSETGIKTYTCNICKGTKTTVIDKLPVNISVKVIGSGANMPTYTLDARRLTVNHDIACKVGYMNNDGSYEALSAEYITDNSYYFDIPDGVTEVIIAVKGDVNADGTVNSADRILIARASLPQTHDAVYTMSELEKFAAEINGDDTVNSADRLLLSRSLLQKSHDAYQNLTW